jgi:hypothetical protein
LKDLPDPNDGHVIAAAIRCGADVIVTFNLKHFPKEVLSKYGIDAQHPDEFIAHQFDLEPNAVCIAAKRQRKALKSPPKTVSEYLSTLEKLELAQTVATLRKYSELI